MSDELDTSSARGNSLGERLASIIGETAIKPAIAKAAPPVGSPGWHAIHAGKESGPFSDSELIEKAVSGELGADDLVKQATGLWGKARDVAFLKNEFRLKEAKKQALDELGRFNGIWVSKRALAIGVGVLMLFVAGAVVWLRTPDDKRIALAKQPDEQKPAPPDNPKGKKEFRPPPDLADQGAPIDPRNKLTDEDKALIDLGNDVKLAPYSDKPLAGIGKSLFVSVVMSPDTKDVLSVVEVKTRVELRLRQSGGTHVRMVGTIWSDGYIGVAGKTALSQQLEGVLDKTLDRFLNEYLAGNPK